MTERCDRIFGERGAILQELVDYLRCKGEFINDSIDIRSIHGCFLYTKILVSTTFFSVLNLEIVRVPMNSERSGPICKETCRLYIPLVLPHPRNSAGVWSLSHNVQHFQPNHWKQFQLFEKNHIFNYSSGELYVLLIDLKKETKL